jgi:spermidine synthase
MEQAGFYTEGYHTIVPSFGDWGFQLASKERLPDQFKKIEVPHQTLPKDVTSLFQFDRDILSYKRRAQVNKSGNLKLHQIYRWEIE